MPKINTPRVEFLSRTNLQHDYRHSIAISLLRGLAALQVAAAHLRAQFYPGLSTLPDPILWYQALSFITGFAHQAVIVFFVLSGWLVGGSLLNKRQQPGIMRDYTIDRMSRLWIVLIPAFMLSLVLGLAAGTLDPSRFDWSPDNEFSVTAFLGNLLGLQGMAVPRFGGNFPLWSLANEIWYYILFPLLVLTFTAASAARRVAAGVAAFLIGTQLSTEIVVYFGIWLLGVGFSRVRIAASAGWMALQILLVLGIATWGRMAGNNGIPLTQSLLQDTAFSLAFLPLLCSLQQKADLTRPGTALLAAFGERLSAISFTLYVVHIPLLIYLGSFIAPMLDGGRLSPENPASLLAYAGLLALVVFAGWLMYLPFEAQTGRLRQRIKKLVLPAPAATGAGA